MATYCRCCYSACAFSAVCSLFFNKKGKEGWEEFPDSDFQKAAYKPSYSPGTGGVFIIVLLLQNNIQLIVPCFLIFYGLALVNAGKFTFGEIFYLGILEIITGLVSAFVPGWGLIFWIFGFGILHIIYGLAMYRKYEA